MSHCTRAIAPPYPGLLKGLLSAPVFFSPDGRMGSKGGGRGSKEVRREARAGGKRQDRHAEANDYTKHEPLALQRPPNWGGGGGISSRNPT